MARSFNQVILVGNLARDPELRTVPSGQSVASFAVATNRVWQDQSGQQQEAADFHNIVAWGKLAELSEQYLKKGRKVMIVGRLQTRSWDAEDGSKRYKTEIVVSEINFLDRPGDEQSANFSESQPTGSAPKTSSSKKAPEDSIQIEDLDDDVDLSKVPF